jgi:hypothetical protein
MIRTSTRSRLRSGALAVALGGAIASLSGCNDAQSGALLGSAFGALAGQAIGGDTEATVIGTAVGLGAGYIIGNESDKAKGHYYGSRGCGNYDY